MDNDKKEEADGLRTDSLDNVHKRGKNRRETWKRKTAETVLYTKQVILDSRKESRKELRKVSAVDRENISLLNRSPD